MKVMLMLVVLGVSIGSLDARRLQDIVRNLPTAGMECYIDAILFYKFLFCASFNCPFDN